MSDDEIGYYRRRADAELEQSRQASCPEAVRAHLEPASAYRPRIARAERTPRANDA